MEEAERPEAMGDAETRAATRASSVAGDAEKPELGGQNPELGSDPQPLAPDPQPEVARLSAEMEGVRSRWLESHRRALLAENAGKVVPELVVGSTVEELERSVEVARGAFESARAAALAEVMATQIPAGNPVRQGPNPESMSPLEKIAHGLKRE